MTVENQFRSLTLELQALKDRVRNFRHTTSWQTDGEWKELVLRNVLQRHLPGYMEPLRGFVTDGRRSSRQIDVLIYDNSKPCLFRAGDLVFLTPDAAAGVVEVKSMIRSRSELRTALKPLTANIEKIRKGGRHDAFAGLFAFDTELQGYRGLCTVLACLHEAARGREQRVIDFVCLGSDIFVLFWEGATNGDDPGPRRLYGYLLPEMAPGYFVNNMVFAAGEESVQRNLAAWFPEHPKEVIALEQTSVDIGVGIVSLGPKAPGR